MLDQILGSKTALKLFLHLFHYGETYSRAIAKDFNIGVSQVQAQLGVTTENGLYSTLRIFKRSQRLEFASFC